MPFVTHLALTEERSADRTILRADGEVDAVTAPRFAVALSRAAGEAEGTLVIDLTRTGFMDVKGFAALLNAHRKVHAREGEMLIVCPSAHIRRLLGVLDIHRHLRFCSEGICQG